VLMLSRRLASPRYLALVDWNLLVMFIGLFVVNHAMAESGMLAQGVATLRAAGIDPSNGGWLFALTVALSNLVSNVPAVMLLMPSTDHPQAGLILALVSTFAGNLIIVGSIANIIVVEQAAKLGIRIGAAEHAWTGVPATLGTLAVAAAWLAILHVAA
jgi:Na+/H+ antiporter NhaD/arsenite permease-like protein